VVLVSLAVAAMVLGFITVQTTLFLYILTGLKADLSRQMSDMQAELSRQISL
jgi:hypothetical protein